MNEGIQTYFDNTGSPWGRLFYRVVWDQLHEPEGEEILDFGSGFGITASHLAEKNRVTAVEPNEEMLELRIRENPYRQILGGLSTLAGLESGSFGFILCHNVLEYAPERQGILRELTRLLKPEGRISVIKHNHPGRVLQKAVNENALEEAAGLLRDEKISVRNFGTVHYYGAEELPQWSQGLVVEKVMGIRTFWALQQNYAVQQEPGWQDNMFSLEKMVYEQDPYRQIAFFHHVMLKNK